MKKTGDSDPEPSAPLPRRRFLASAAAVTAGFTIVPRHVLGGQAGPAPSDKLNIAGIGIGGMGSGDVDSCAQAGENIVALCDPDRGYLEQNAKKYPRAKLHTDFRKMLETQKDIDAVLIATPDHIHAVATAMAMKRP